MKWLFLIKSVCAVIAAFAMLGWAVKTGGTGPIFSQPARVSGNAKIWAWVMSINVAVSGKTTLALNIVSLTSSKVSTDLLEILTNATTAVGPHSLRKQAVSSLLATPVHSSCLLVILFYWYSHRICGTVHLWHSILGPNLYYRSVDEPCCRILLCFCIWSGNVGHEHLHKFYRN